MVSNRMRGERGRGRTPFRWMEGVRKACAERGMGLEEAKRVCRDRNVWRRMIDKLWTETHFRRGARGGWAPQLGLS